LKHFLAGYRVLTHLPQAKLKSVDIIPMIEQLVSLLKYPVKLTLPEKVMLMVDVAQLEQCLINLLKNAYEASDKEGEIDLLVKEQENKVVIYIVDKGPGIQNLDNVFVPLFTTKAQGTGIGLSLCKQIIEGHQGQLNLSNRAEGGCQVEINLPR
jgi:signal transduction histidine kinase